MVGVSRKQPLPASCSAVIKTGFVFQGLRLSNTRVHYPVVPTIENQCIPTD